VLIIAAVLIGYYEGQEAEKRAKIESAKYKAELEAENAKIRAEMESEGAKIMANLTVGELYDLEEFGDDLEKAEAEYARWKR
jgi:hypothetical protein